MDANVLAAFEELRQQDDANGVCFDGGVGEPTWASVSHGVFLSIGACGVHRSLGVKVSYVQSTTMDSWKPIHLRMMRLGGNKRFQDFLDSHGVPRDMPIREKYQTRAAAWYRECLRAEAEGREVPEPLPAGTGHLSCNDVQSPEQRVLDAVFAEPPRDGEMTHGGVPEGSSGPQASGARRCALAAMMRAHVAAVADLPALVRGARLQEWCGILALKAGEIPDARSRSRSRSPSPPRAPSPQPIAVVA